MGSDNKDRKEFEKLRSLIVMSLLCYAKRSFYGRMNVCEGKYGCHVVSEVLEEA